MENLLRTNKIEIQDLLNNGFVKHSYSTRLDLVKDRLWRECVEVSLNMKDTYNQRENLLDTAEMFDNYLEIPNFENHLLACDKIINHILFLEMRYLIKKCRKLKLIWLVNSIKH